MLSQFFNTKLSLSVSLFEREHPELAPVPHFCGFQVNSEQEGLKLIENNKVNLQSEFSHCLETSGELLVQSDRRYIHIHILVADFHGPKNLYIMYTKTGTKARGKIVHSHYANGEGRHRKKLILLMSERLTVLVGEIKIYLYFHCIFLGTAGASMLASMCTSLFLLILSGIQLHTRSCQESCSHTLYTRPLCLFQTWVLWDGEEKHQKNMRIPQATASSSLSNDRGVATRLNVELKKHCLCTGSLW